MFDVTQLRAQFPILKRQLGGRDIVFVDNAATSLKPQCVIDAVNDYYTRVCANVHRGINVLAQEADGLYEEARGNVARLIRARPDEIIFVRNATEGINLAAHIVNAARDDEIICALTDHHSNFLPWRVRSRVRLVPPDDEGRATARAFIERMNGCTKLVALGHVSNVTGVVTPVGEIIAEARRRGIVTVVDGAQSVGHMPIDVKELGCDFLAFSGHKMLAPSGIGVLYGRRELLDAAPPMLFGGGMASRVAENDFEPESLPHKFEAGTPNIEGALGLGAAASFLNRLGMDDVLEHSRALAEALYAEMAAVPDIRIVAQKAPERQIPILSFAHKALPADQIAAILCNRYNIMVRSGVHCAEPLVRHFGEKGLVRASLYLYNTLDEVKYIAESVRALCELLVA